MTKIAAVFRIAVKQKLRDRMGLSLMILTAPLFVVFYWVFFSNATPRYDIVFFSKGDSEAAGQLFKTLRTRLEHCDSGRNTPVVHIEVVTSETALLDRLKRGESALGVIMEPLIPPKNGIQLPMARVTLAGDVSSAGYQVSRVILERGLEAVSTGYLKQRSLFQVEERPVGISGVKTPFEAYVPGLLVFSVIMLVFSSSMSVVREVEAGTLGRLRMSPVSGFELLLGLSAPQLILGILSALLTFATAWMLGFRSHGSLLLSALVTGIACAASVGIGIVVAAISRNQAGTLVEFPLEIFGIILPTQLACAMATSLPVLPFLLGAAIPVPSPGLYWIRVRGFSLCVISRGVCLWLLSLHFAANFCRTGASDHLRRAAPDDPSHRIGDLLRAGVLSSGHHGHLELGGHHVRRIDRDLVSAPGSAATWNCWWRVFDRRVFADSLWCP